MKFITSIFIMLSILLVSCGLPDNKAQANPPAKTDTMTDATYQHILDMCLPVQCVLLGSAYYPESFLAPFTSPEGLDYNLSVKSNTWLYHMRVWNRSLGKWKEVFITEL